MEPETTPDQSVSTLPAPTDFVEEFGNEQGSDITRYVVVNINHNLYGMSTESTVELMSSTIAQVTRVPHSPDFIAGVINHRGTIIPVIDMRSLFGFEPRASEAKKLAAKFEKLKNDHVLWLNALQDAVYTNTAFDKEINPTKCGFGKWYATVLSGASTMSDMIDEDPVLAALIQRFDEPHRTIHALAEKVLGLKEDGQIEKAIELIDSTRETELAEMCELFDLVHEAVTTQLDSMMVITEVGSRKAAIAVDGVSFVADCTEDSVEPLPDTADNTEFLSGLVHQDDGTYILITDLEHIYNIACPKE